MDNEELDGVKFSEFPSQTPVNADEVVGLHSGDNARFSIANIVAAIRQGLANIFVPKTDVGAANGVASLDNTGKVPSIQLPPIASTAADVTYDNTGSGLTADDVQEAIDELAQGGGGGGTTVVANPSGEATDSLDKLQVENTIYQIPVGGKPINYSTDEKYTGQKWVDGKKIYQKTLAIKRTDLQDRTMTNSNVAGFIYLTENYPMIWIDESASVLFHPSTTDGVTAQPVNYDGGSTYTRLNIARAPSRNSGKQYIYFQTTYWASLFYNSDAWTLYITIKYTKTTDTPTPPGGLYVDADEVTYDNTASGLSATDVQAAVDELAGGKANQAQLAYVETGTTASRNYTAGQYISLNGLLYTADTAIANGTTFYTSGGNKNLTECAGGGFNTSDTYRKGETASVAGLWAAICGAGGNIDACVPLKKKIPSNATVTVSGLTLGWIRDSNGAVSSATYGGVSLLGDNVLVNYHLQSYTLFKTYFIYITAGTITFG